MDCFLTHIARAQHVSAEDGLYCPLQIRQLAHLLLGIILQRNKLHYYFLTSNTCDEYFTVKK